MEPSGLTREHQEVHEKGDRPGGSFTVRRLMAFVAVVGLAVSALVIVERPGAGHADRVTASPVLAGSMPSTTPTPSPDTPSTDTPSTDTASTRSTTSGTFDCGLGLPCAGGGSFVLPGTRVVVTSGGPHKQLVQGPAATAWYPFEQQARAFVAAIHQVPNDDRLLAVGRDAVRAVLFAQLLDMVERQGAGETLTAEEAAAVEALHAAVHRRRVAARDFAIAEYDRWHADPCSFDPPEGFSFDPYDPICLPITGLVGPPNPPSLEQFEAYGAALAYEPFLDADTMAAADRTELGIAFATTLGLAAATATVVAAVVASSPVLAATLLAGMGSVTVVKTSFVGAALFGVGTKVSMAAFGGAALGAAAAVAAASVVMIVVVAAVVTILGAIQLADNLQIRPSLVEARERAAAFDLPSLLTDSDGQPNEEGTLDLFAAFFLETVPDFRAERAAMASAPSSWSPAQPRWRLERPNGSVEHRDVLWTLNWDSLQEETFIHDGYFVTRTRTGTGLGDDFGPPRLSLTIQYLDDDLTPRMVGLSGGLLIDRGFADVLDATPGDDAFETFAPRLVTSGDEGSVVSVGGNSPPTLNPQILGELTVGEEITFVANADDPDGDEVTVEWYIEHPDGGAPLNPSTELCGAAPVSGDPLAPRCPWPRSDGQEVTLTYPVSGAYRGFVLARDEDGATASQWFYFDVTAGELVVTVDDLSPIVIDENGAATISGQVSYPGQDRIVLTVDWGDGTRTRRFFPCAFGEFEDGELVSDPGCMFVLPGGLRVGGGPSPWSFEVSKSFRHHLDRPLPPDQTIRVWAELSGGVRTPEQTIPITVNSEPPEIQLAAGFTDATCAPSNDPLLPNFCLGENRTARTGEPVTITGRIVDDPSARHLFVVDWGDGGRTVLDGTCRDQTPLDAACPSSENPPISPALDEFSGLRAYNFAVDHTYTTRGEYEVTFKAYDGDPAGPAVAVAAALALNESPTVGDRSVVVSPGETFSEPAPGLLSSASDPDGDDLFAWLLDEPQLGTVEIEPDGSWSYQAGDEPGTDSFTFVVSDGFDGEATGTVLVTVGQPTPPEIEFVAQIPHEVDEGAPAAFGFTVTAGSSGSQPEVTADCVGGTMVSIVFDGSESGTVTCTWPTGGTAAAPVSGEVVVTATDPPDGAEPPLSSTAGVEITVLNVAPTITSLTVARRDPVLAGDEVSLHVRFDDPGETSFVAAIDWGDGSGPQPVGSVARTGFDVAHRYASPGVSTVTVSVTDAQGATGIRTAEVEIQSVVGLLEGAIAAVTGPSALVTAITGHVAGSGGRPGAVGLVEDHPHRALDEIVAALAALEATSAQNGPARTMLSAAARRLALDVIERWRTGARCPAPGSGAGAGARCAPSDRLRIEVALLHVAHGNAAADRGSHLDGAGHYRWAVAGMR